VTNSELQDSFGRRFRYLRLSLTEACNFRCIYCLPNGYQRSHQGSFLSPQEIAHLTRAFAELGTKKMRLTGGEPTLRTDLLPIIRQIREMPQIEKIALSTNGFRLKEMAADLRKSGLDALNVSLDTLDEKKFFAMTGFPYLPRILEGIEVALKVGFPFVKVNAVLMKSWNYQDLDLFLTWIQDRPVSVRFIELMPTGQNHELFREHHVSARALTQQLLDRGWSPLVRGETDGPAQEFAHPNYQGRMGIIAPYAPDFCSTCNRLRVTALGGLRLCLFGEGNYSLRDLLQGPEQLGELKDRLVSVLRQKEISHFLDKGKYGNNHGFSAIGG